jgi:hypothetical protein
VELLLQCVLFSGGSSSNSMVVILRDDVAELKMKLKCSQEQFVDLQKHYTQQLIQPDLRLMSASLLTTEEPP